MAPRIPNYESPNRRFAVYVSREHAPCDKHCWALYASTYKDEEDARQAALRALSSGYKQARMEITQLFILAS